MTTPHSTRGPNSQGRWSCSWPAAARVRTRLIRATLLLAAIASGTAAGTAAASPVPGAPRSDTSDPRVRVQPYESDRVFDVPVQRGVLTHLVLPAGETPAIPPATGVGARCDDESHAWCIVHQGRDLFIRAKASARTNNLIVVTERRRYAFELRAVERGGLMRLTMEAPKSEAPANSTPEPTAPAHRTAAVADVQERLRQRLEQVAMPRNAQYSVAVGARSEDIVPAMVFDDARFTYFRFPANRPLPAVFQTGADGSEETVNVRMAEDDLLVADRVARRFVLRLGQSVVVIVNDAFDLDGVAPRDGTTVPGVARSLRPAASTVVPAAPATSPATGSVPRPTATAVASTAPQMRSAEGP